jgi:anti-sigma B factor antagonist
MRSEVELRDGFAIVRPIGEFDLATADEFSARTERLLAEGHERLVVDLRHLTFMDSSGVRAIVKLNTDAPHLQIVEGPDHVRRLFTITGLRRVLQFIATEALDEH